MSVVLALRGDTALSPFRIEKLLQKARAAVLEASLKLVLEFRDTP